ncbi:MAG TPA: MarR family transcriptional regulator [Gammaproteobacteria bacterium]|nr:MarR family transcriptional regulator [Gammaproteobacteria bacterium]
MVCRLERAHYLMLLLLMKDGPQSVGRLAERLRLDASTVTRQVTVMLERGLVEKQPNPEDRRGGVVCATARGRQEALEMRRQRGQRLATLFSDWPDARRQALAEALGELNQSLCRVLDEDAD